MNMLSRIKIQRTWVVLGIALLIGGLSALLASRYLHSRIQAIEDKEKNQAKVRVVVATEDLPKGARLERKFVAARDIPREWVHSMAITEAQYDRAENGVLSAPAVRGEPVIWSQLEGLKAASFSRHLAAGRRAITLPVDEVSSVSGMLEPGDRIDIVCTVKKDGNAVIFSVIQNALVLAAGTRVNPKAEADGKDASFSTVTLDASPDDATRVIAAREVGKVTAMLRAPEDASLVATAKQDAMSVLGLSTGHASLTGIPVIYGGLGGKLADVPGLKGTRSTP